MTSLRRALLVVSALLLGVPLAWVFAPKPAAAEDRPAKPATAKSQPEPANTKPDRDGEFSDSIKLSANRKARKSMEAAQDFIQEEDWLKATHILQGLLDTREDSFV